MNSYNIASEICDHRDPSSGIKIRRWTGGGSKCQHLYFTTPSVTDDGELMVVIGERTGSPNLFLIHRDRFIMEQISNATSLRRTYAYPNGGPDGLSKVSPALDAVRKVVYWIQDCEVLSADLSGAPGRSGKIERIFRFRKDLITAYTHLSKCGNRLCICGTDEKAFGLGHVSQHDQLKSVPRMIASGRFSSRLYIIDTNSGTLLREIEVPFWVTHVQFDPQNSDRILCNSEGVMASFSRRRYPYWGRIWSVRMDGSYSRLFVHREGEFVNHENWSATGRRVVYHGIRRNGVVFRAIWWLSRKTSVFPHARRSLQRRLQHFVGGRAPSGEAGFSVDVTIPISHAVSTWNDEIVLIDSRNGGIYTFIPGTGHLSFVASHNSSMKNQDSHPHPVWSTKHSGIVFTSDSAGVCNVYEAEVE